MQVSYTENQFDHNFQKQHIAPEIHMDHNQDEITWVVK